MGKTLISAIEITSRTGTLRAVDYLRVSTEEQLKGYGIAYSGKRTKKYIEKKHWTHVDTYSDEGVSGSLEAHERDGLANLMADARKKPRPFDVVVVNEGRVIGRTGRAFWRWVWELEDLGVFVANVKGDYDNTTDAGRSKMRKDADYAEEEREAIRSRTQGGIQEKAEEGGHPGGKARYGYRIKNKGQKGEQILVLDECDGEEACTRTDPCTTLHEMPTLRIGRQLAVTHKGNWSKVAAGLNSEGRLTRGGRPWSATNIRGRLMEEDFLAGRFVFRSKRNAILDSDGNPVWGESLAIQLDPPFTPEEVQELREATKDRMREYVPGRFYVLSGHIVSPCGGKYVGGSKIDDSLSYRCSKKEEDFPGQGRCACSQLAAEPVEKWAWEKVCELLGNATRLRELAEQWVGGITVQQGDLGARLAELDQKVAELNSTIGVVTSATARQAIRQGCTEEEAEHRVDEAVRPLQEELERLEVSRKEVSAWQSEVSAAEGRAERLQRLAQLANTRLVAFTREQQREFVKLLDIKIEVLEQPLRRKSMPCPVITWFREHERLVPTLTDEVWDQVKMQMRFPGGSSAPRQKGSLSARQALEALLEKARSGLTFEEAGAPYGSMSLRGFWRRWLAAGTWDELMVALESVEGVETAEPNPLPRMRLEGWARPELLIGAFNGGSDRKIHGPEADPWQSAHDPVGYPVTATTAWVPSHQRSSG